MKDTIIEKYKELIATYENQPDDSDERDYYLWDKRIRELTKELSALQSEEQPKEKAIKNDMIKIKNISEAFSMQPKCFSLCYFEIFRDGPMDHVHNDECITRIEIETIQVSDSGRQDYYIGYNSKGNKLFSYIAKACNVEYCHE